MLLPRVEALRLLARCGTWRAAARAAKSLACSQNSAEPRRHDFLAMSSRLVTKSALATPSPGEGILDICDRLSRLSTRQFPPVAPQAAAVLVPLFEDEEGTVRVLLTQRSSNLSTHQGEVCLPGGKRDPEDPDDVHCALREAQEELGLNPDTVQIIAQLPPFLSKHKLSVTPIIGRLMTKEALTPNPSEVHAVFDMPLAAFLQDVPSHTYKDTEWQGMQFRLHFFEYNNFVVWGLTAAMLIQVAQHAFARPTGFLELTPGSRPYHQLFFNGERLLWRDEQAT